MNTNTPEYKDHPLAKLFPVLPTTDIKELAADIKANGQQMPIILLAHNGEPHVLDGRNRMKACLKAEIEPRTTMWDDYRRELPNPEIAPVDWIVSMNLKRRHLSDSQRDAIAGEIITFRAAQEREADLARELALGDGDENPHVETAGTEEERVEETAKQLNVKPRNVRKSVNIQKKGSSRIKAAHKSGELSTAAAERLAKQEKSKQEKLDKATAKELQQEAKRLAKEEAKLKKNKAFGAFVALAVTQVNELAVKTGKAQNPPSWEDYHKKVVDTLEKLA